MTGTPGNVSLEYPEDLSPRHAALFCRDWGMVCSHPNAPRLGKLSGTLWPGFVTWTFLHSRMDPSKSHQSFRLWIAPVVRGLNEEGKQRDPFLITEAGLQKCFDHVLLRKEWYCERCSKMFSAKGADLILRSQQVFWDTGAHMSMCLTWRQRGGRQVYQGRGCWVSPSWKVKPHSRDSSHCVPHPHFVH